MDKKSEEKLTRKPMETSSGKDDCGQIKCTETEYQLDQNRMIWGWQSIDECAASVWGSIHSSLLAGDLVFAYRTPNSSEKLKQLVVVRNFDLTPTMSGNIKHYTSYGVGYITSGYTALLPNVPFRYIKNELMDLLKDWKIDKNVLATFTAIIENLEIEENNGQRS